MLGYSFLFSVLLVATVTAEQEDLNSHLSSDLPIVRLKNVQEQLSQLRNQLNTLSSQMTTLLTYRQSSCNGQSAITDCSEVSSQESGIFPLKICSKPFHSVYCNQSFEEGGWMVIYNRSNGQHGSFNQTWESYKRGFGQPDGEHFIGLKRLHFLTYGALYEVAFILNQDGTEHVAIYDHFEIDNERDYFPIRVIGRARGDLRIFPDTTQLVRFQTYDRNNLHPQARATMIEEECGFWFVDMPYSHASVEFRSFCADLRRFKIMIRKRITV